VAAAVAITGYAVWVGNPRWYAGLLFFVAAYLYWQAIQWVDRHGSWKRDDEEPRTIADLPHD